MSSTTAFRRGAAALGASGLIALSLAGPAAARPDPGTGNLHDGVGTRQDYVPSGNSGSGPATVITFDDNAVEYLQLGAGILAGLALAGAGMAVASRRTHAHTAHPA